MKIEVGKYYKRRDGMVVGPTVGVKGPWPFAFTVDGVRLFTPTGRTNSYEERPVDLVEESDAASKAHAEALQGFPYYYGNTRLSDPLPPVALDFTDNPAAAAFAEDPTLFSPVAGPKSRFGAAITSQRGVVYYGVECSKLEYEAGKAAEMAPVDALAQAGVVRDLGEAILGSKTTKAGMLDTAKAAVADRGLNYGHPEDNFARIAELWNVHLVNIGTLAEAGGMHRLTPGDVAMMMCLMKIARLENDPSHLDSWTDLAGYAACGAEISA